MKKVAVTGAGGYIGTQLVRDLVNQGFEVLAIDRFFFGMDPMKDFLNSGKVRILKKDIRDIEKKDFENVYAVCDLACLSNDPAGEINPELTYSINRDGRIHIARVAKESGVEKYIISSSCSVYGTGGDQNLTETSKTNPISVYAKSTLDAEQENLEKNNNEFSVTSLRNATVFGLSKRMRFDLVVNLMTLTAFQKNRIIIMGGGMQWRPLVHLSDVSSAFLKVINADKKIVNGQIFNIGLDNYRIKNLAFAVKEEIPNHVEIDVAPDDADKRDYKVSFAKVKDQLNFVPQITVNEGVKEIYKALKSGEVDTGIKTITVQWYKNIIEAKNLLDDVMLNGRLI